MIGGSAEPMTVVNLSESAVEVLEDERVLRVAQADAPDLLLRVHDDAAFDTEDSRVGRGVD